MLLTTALPASSAASAHFVHAGFGLQGGRGHPAVGGDGFFGVDGEGGLDIARGGGAAVADGLEVAAGVGGDALQLFGAW